VKIRGTALHIGEKYLQLARDAQSSGDPVMAESYLQHAEHYFRLIASAQQAQQQNALNYMRQPGDPVLDEDEDDELSAVPDRFASPQDRFVVPQQPGFAPPSALASAPQPTVDRGFFPTQDRPTYERPERVARPERPYQDKPYQDRSFGERQFHSRESEGRNPRGGRQPREFPNEPTARAEPRLPAADDLDRKGQGLPAFITAPVRPQPEVQDDSAPPIQALTTVLDDQPEAEREVNGFHLRPRRRRRTKADLVLNQDTRAEDTSARDPVGD
jgi:hypothetical protein